MSHSHSLLILGSALHEPSSLHGIAIPMTIRNIRLVSPPFPSLLAPTSSIRRLLPSLCQSSSPVRRCPGSSPHCQRSCVRSLRWTFCQTLFLLFYIPQHWASPAYTGFGTALTLQPRTSLGFGCFVPVFGQAGFQLARPFSGQERNLPGPALGLYQNPRT